MEDGADSEIEVCSKPISNPVVPITLRIEFETPVWLEHQGKLDETLDFPAFFVHIYRRLTMLCALYGGFNAEDDARFVPLRAQAEHVQTLHRGLKPMHWERLSVESGKRHPMHGIIGELSFRGPLLPFLPILRMAEATHIGKSTSFGLGRFRIDSKILNTSAA